MRNLEGYIAVKRRTTLEGARARIRLANVIAGLMADDALWMALHEDLMEAYRAKQEEMIKLPPGEEKAALLGEANQLCATQDLLSGMVQRFQRMTMEFQQLDAPSKSLDISNPDL